MGLVGSVDVVGDVVGLVGSVVGLVGVVEVEGAEAVTVMESTTFVPLL